MATITTLRPSSLSSGVGWSAVPSGTLYGVTSDDSDSTYALWSGAGSVMILGTPAGSPPAGEQRHQVRLRARGEDGDAWWAVRLASGAITGAAAASFPTSPATVSGSWGFGAPRLGSTVLYAYVTGQSTGLKIEELYLDVDTREAPTFTAQTVDGSGAVTTTISDTSQPTIRATALDLDGLNPRQYHYWVTLDGGTVWDSGVLPGTPADQQTSPLVNGDYVANLQIFTTIGQNGLYASDVQTVEFTVATGDVDEPDEPTVTAVEGAPFFNVNVCTPFVDTFDGSVGWVEVQRVGCPGEGYLSVPGVDGAYASTPDDVPGPDDLQITVRAQRFDGWRPAADQVLVSKYVTDADHRSFFLGIDASGDGDPARAGRPFVTWSEDGDSNGINQIFVPGAARMPIEADGSVTLRVLLVMDNGAGGYEVTFSTLAADGTWVPLGPTVVGGSTSSIFWSDEPIEVGSAEGGTDQVWDGRIYSVEVRDGALGTIIVDPDFSGYMSGTRSFTDEAGNVWTVNGTATIVSEQVISTIAMVGPMMTDQCQDYVDYWAPRSGLGVSCGHVAGQCCSSYRIRTLVHTDGSLQVSDWTTNPDLFCLDWSENYQLLRTTGPDGPLWAQVPGTVVWDRDRPFTSAIGVNGGRFTTSAPPGGRNVHLSTAVESEADLQNLLAVLARPLVLISPSDADEVWAAPVAASVKVIKIGRIRQVTADFLATGIQPPPQSADLVNDFAYPGVQNSVLEDDYGPTNTWIAVINGDTGTEWPTDGVPFEVLAAGELMNVIGASARGSVAEADGTFEESYGFGYYSSNVTVTTSTVRAFKGVQSALMTITGTPATAFFRTDHTTVPVPSAAGRTYRVSFWAWRATTGNVTAVASAINAGGSSIGTATNTVSVPAATWTEVAVTYTTPALTVSLEYGPQLSSPANGTEVWIDNLDAVRTDVDTGRQLLLVQRSQNGVVQDQTAGTRVLGV
jgi:hypothetical protein